PIVDGEAVARLHEVPGHGPTHDAEADESDGSLHRVRLLYLALPRLALPTGTLRGDHAAVRAASSAPDYDSRRPRVKTGFAARDFPVLSCGRAWMGESRARRGARPARRSGPGRQCAGDRPSDRSIPPSSFVSPAIPASTRRRRPSGRPRAAWRAAPMPSSSLRRGGESSPWTPPTGRGPDSAKAPDSQGAPSGSTWVPAGWPWRSS